MAMSGDKPDMLEVQSFVKAVAKKGLEDLESPCEAQCRKVCKCDWGEEDCQ